MVTTPVLASTGAPELPGMIVEQEINRSMALGKKGGAIAVLENRIPSLLIGCLGFDNLGGEVWLGA